MHWFYSGSKLKSNREVNRLVQDVLQAPDFEKSDFSNFTNVEQEEAILDEHCESSGAFSMDNGWHTASVSIQLPKEGVKYKSETDAPVFEVHGLQYRRLLGVIRTAYEDMTQRSHHIFPFKLFHQRVSPFTSSQNLSASSVSPTTVEDLSSTSGVSTGFSNEIPKDAERVYSEVYTADAMLEEDAKLQALPRQPEDSDDLEYAIAPILLWSDSTHLASFGTAALWPIYCFFAGISKYLRCKPSTFSAHHLAYLPSVRCLYSSPKCF